jgi:Holliday junction resolvase RusA-like endonuclease
MKLVMPWGCVISKNNKFTVWRRGQPALTKTYRDAKEEIHKRAVQQLGKKKPYNVRVEVRFDLYAPDKRRRDILNYMQILCDGIEGAAYDNDSLIDYAVVRRMPTDKENPRVEIRIKEYAPVRLPSESAKDVQAE